MWKAVFCQLFLVEAFVKITSGVLKYAGLYDQDAFTRRFGNLHGVLAFQLREKLETVYSSMTSIRVSKLTALLLNFSACMSRHRSLCSFSSEERLVGKECVRTFRSRCSPFHYKKKK